MVFNCKWYLKFETINSVNSVFVIEDLTVFWQERYTSRISNGPISSSYISFLNSRWRYHVSSIAWVNSFVDKMCSPLPLKRLSPLTCALVEWLFSSDFMPLYSISLSNTNNNWWCSFYKTWKLLFCKSEIRYWCNLPKHHS